MSDDDQIVSKYIPYTIMVESAWKAFCTSPISGKEIVAYADEMIEAKQKVDLILFQEANDRGLSVHRTKPPEKT